MFITRQPPKVDGMAIEPEVDFGTAVDDDEPPPTLAVPFATLYVHVMPFTISLAATSGIAADRITATTIITNFFIMFRYLLPRLSFTR